MNPVHHFRHCPACGAERSADATAGVSPLQCRGCGFTFYFNAAISAAVFLWREDGRVLMIRRAKDPGRGMLGPPGGFVDVGERVEVAVRREVREEVGLEMTDVAFLGSFPNEYLYRGVTYPVLDLFFSARAVRPETAQALDDVDGLVWVEPFEELDPDQLAFPSVRRALEVLRRRPSGAGFLESTSPNVPPGAERE